MIYPWNGDKLYTNVQYLLEELVGIDWYETLENRGVPNGQRGIYCCGPMHCFTCVSVRICYFSVCKSNTIYVTMAFTAERPHMGSSHQGSLVPVNDAVIAGLTMDQLIYPTLFSHPLLVCSGHVVSEAALLMMIYMYVCMATTYNRLWINRS